MKYENYYVDTMLVSDHSDNYYNVIYDDDPNKNSSAKELGNFTITAFEAQTFGSLEAAITGHIRTFQIDTLFAAYEQAHQEEPQYAKCEICFLYMDEGVQSVTIKLSSNIDEEKDREVFFFVNSLAGLKSLTRPGVNDFVVTECYEFRSGI